MVFAINSFLNEGIFMDMKTYALFAMLIGFGLIVGTLALGIYLAKRKTFAE